MHHAMNYNRIPESIIKFQSLVSDKLRIKGADGEQTQLLNTIYLCIPSRGYNDDLIIQPFKQLLWWHYTHLYSTLVSFCLEITSGFLVYNYHHRKIYVLYKMKMVIKEIIHANNTLSVFNFGYMYRYFPNIV